MLGFFAGKVKQDLQESLMILPPIRMFETEMTLVSITHLSLWFGLLQNLAKICFFLRFPKLFSKKIQNFLFLSDISIKNLEWQKN
jgi:hypothetical protein